MIGTESLTDLYVEVQHFYARQMHLLDGGAFEEYAATFTEDGEFTHTPQQPPARTRAGIVAELNRFHQRFADDPVVRRHWFNMLKLDPLEGGDIAATYYALVVTTRPGRNVTIAPSCVVHDVLVRENGALLTRSRKVDHDQVP
ncbi:nuclear transport factor 2 family protein [Micromonospora marina]|uniref:Actinorhodin biosynthesis protein ActVIA n=1 Tax=Micromonospora marina TaxID=307120 RepID=A0A1C4ZWH8_9ACTN|nr:MULTISPECIES: nuclear transport factor 2 family protein [Micromonospora]SCF37236.1 actinorhodin biosynthesis protein ActVIA [Micromonospora marina]